MNVILEVCKLLKTVLKARAPYDTGNLAINSIRIVDNSVTIGGSEIADYAIYTNEPWTNGRKNPNEGWVDRAIQEAKPLIEKLLYSEAGQKELAKSMTYYNGIIKERKEKMIKKLKKEKQDIKDGIR